MQVKTKNTSAVSVNIDAVELTPGEAIDLIVGKYLTGDFARTILFRGSPGIGKSSLAREAAERLKATYPDFHYVEINPTMPADEVGGIPELVRVPGKPTRTDYALPAWFPTAKDNPDWKGIINLDDALQGDRLMQQTLANLIQARNLRRHPLPEGAMIIATGNRIEDGAGVTRTLTHFADRMCWVNIVADPVSWVQDFAIPKGLSEKVIGYIMYDKSKLDMFDPKADKCPTPRTWEAVSGWVKYLETLNNPNDIKRRNKLAQAVLGGELGIGEATKFWAFCDLFGRVPNPDDIFKDPENHSIDYPLDLQYATVVAIANRLEPANFDAALTYIDRIGPDMTTLAVKLGAANKPELYRSDAMAKWAVKNQDVIH